MLFLLSPAKALDYDTPAGNVPHKVEAHPPEARLRQAQHLCVRHVRRDQRHAQVPAFARGDGFVPDTVRIAYSKRVLGGLFSAIAMFLLSQPLTKAALQFGPSDLFAVTFMGLSILTCLDSDHILNCIISGLIGLLLAWIALLAAVGWALGRGLRVEEDLRRFLPLLHNRAMVADHALPHTGVPLELERALSSVFIATPSYGTRASSVIALHPYRAEFLEQSFGPQGLMGETHQQFLF